MTRTTTTASVGDTRDVGLAAARRDIPLLVARLGLGALMIWHAKLTYDFGGSIAGVIVMFEQTGVPLPVISAPANLFGELLGGAALIAGLGVRLVGVLMAVNMLGAWVFVHTSALYATDHNGPELVIALGLLSIMLAVTGSGRIGLDHLRQSRHSERAQGNAVVDEPATPVRAR